VALFQLESSSNEEMEFERVRFRELGCGCSKDSQTCTATNLNFELDKVVAPIPNLDLVPLLSMHLRNVFISSALESLFSDES
jgi:hypothetical protein